MITDSAEKNDSNEVSVDDGDNTKDNSAESGGEAADSGEDDAPSVEIADEPYVPQASVEDLKAGSDDTDSGEAKAETNDGDSNEQQAGDADSKEASADEEEVNQGEHKQQYYY